MKLKQGSLSDNEIRKISEEFIMNNPFMPFDRLILFERGMREFRDKYHDPLMQYHGIINKNVCDNITRKSDAIIKKTNDSYYCWQKEKNKLLEEIKLLKNK